MVLAHGKIRKYLDVNATKSLVNSTFTSRLDYCNSLLHGLDAVHLKPLQMCQNNAARVITSTPKRDHITPVLRELHWLPVKQRLEYKIILLTFKCRVGRGPQYLSDMPVLSPYVPPRPLRSQDKDLLDVPPRARLDHYGGRAFVNAAPELWNSLPHKLRAMWSLSLEILLNTSSEP